MTSETLEIDMSGPYSWLPSPSNSDPPFLGSAAAKLAGVYLWTVPRPDGLLVYAAGYTTRSFAGRVRAHTKNYLSGRYTILNVGELLQGRRKEIWHGLFYKKASATRLDEYHQRATELEARAREQLQTFRIVLLPMVTEERMMRRVEAAVMHALYAAQAALAAIPDRGMSLAPRWKSEAPVRIRLRSGPLLLGLPREFDA